MIRGGDRSWKYEGEGSKKGKQAHMSSAVEEICMVSLCAD